MQVGSGHLVQCSFLNLRVIPLTSSLGLELEQVSAMEGQGFAVCYSGIDGFLAAIFGVANAPRPERLAAMQGLGEFGVESAMLTTVGRSLCGAGAQEGAFQLWLARRRGWRWHQ